MSTSKESIDKISAYYKKYGLVLKRGGIDPSRNELYGMHIGYYDSNPVIYESVSKLMERKVIKEADIKNGQQILDAGCGTGTLVFEIASLYSDTKIFGIDLLEDHLKITSKYSAKFNNVAFSNQDYLNLGFKDRVFDRIIFCESLVHSKDKNKLLEEAHRVLKPKGKIIIADVFLLKNNLDKETRLSLSNFSEKTGIPIFENIYNFRQNLERLGFRNISLHNLTNNLSSTLYSEDGLNSYDPSVQLKKDSNLVELESLLSIIGELYLNKNVGYFIVTANVQKTTFAGSVTIQ